MTVLPDSLLDGRPLYLEFFSTLCPISQQEVPVLLQWAARHPEIRVAVVTAEAPDIVAAYFSQFTSVPVDILLDPGQRIARRYGIEGTPSAYLTDAHGRVFYARVGGPNRLDNFDAQLGKLNIAWSR